MKTLFKAAVAALTIGAATAGLAAPAQAQYRYDRGDRDKAALAAGVAGLAIGAAIGSSGNRNYGYNQGYAQPYYNQGYNYGPAYGYGYAPPRHGYYNRGYGYYAPRTCVVRQRVWDPYIGRWVRVRERVPC